VNTIKTIKAMTFEHNIKKEKDINVISFKGQLIEKSQAGSLNEKIDELLEDKQVKYVLDLSELKYMNSSGLNILINILTRTRKAGGEAVIANVSSKINELLIVTRLNTVFTVTDTVDTALNQLTNNSN
jgi:anti-sigma B factor antagonist